MSHTLTRTAEIEVPPYPPGTQWDLVIPFLAADYDLTGKEAILQFRKNQHSDPIFELKTGEHADFAISGQTITLGLKPATASTLATANTFDEIFDDNDALEFRIDFQVASAAVADYRIQGVLLRETSHGRRRDH